jgi:two-component system chemotaxis sensor kinase CheA
VVVEEMFAYLWKKLQTRNDEVTKEFRQILHTFSSLSDRLRTDILAIRKVEAGVLLQKAPRIVRDIAAQAGKSIKVTCSGEALKIDKSYIDLLDAPLLHMVRNAADHGIETPEKRAAAGKPGEGNIYIALEEKENVLELSIRDDGNGLDYEAIARKAVSLGLTAPGDALTDELVTQLIFASGVSTAQTVSEVSGRGVGMDVVKRAVESAKGRISIVSVKGKGCTFSVALPRSVSTRILDGYLVRACGGEVYVLPMGSVIEAFSAERSGLSTVAGKGKMVIRHEKLMPVVALGEKLAGRRGGGRPSSHPENGGDRLTMVSVKAGKGMCALMVEGILGVQKIVAKPIAGLAVEKDLFDGAAMLGDGGVAMIISESGLTKLMEM